MTMQNGAGKCRRAAGFGAVAGWTLWPGVLFALLAVDPVSAQRLPRDNLLLFRDADGQVREVAGTGDWLIRRQACIAAMQEIMGPLPDRSGRCDLAVEVLEEVDCGTHVRRLITYQSEPGSRVPAFLAIPHAVLAGESSAAAALCLHPTDDLHGHQVVHGLGGRPNRQYAAELAERGWVTLAPAYPLLANYQPDLEALGYASGTMKAIWDNMRGVDLLVSIPGVDPDRIASIGHSLGGHNSVYTAVFDGRIGAVVSSCGLDAYVDYMDGDIRGWTSTRYMPRLLDYRDRVEAIPFDFHELIGALAPRHCLILAPTGDSNFKADSVDRVAAAAGQIYRLYGVESRLRLEHPDGDHDFPSEWRQEAYRFLEEALPCPKPSS